MNERAYVHIIPTELDRADVFWDLSAVVIALLSTWQMLLLGWGWWSVSIPIVAAVFSLSGEAAADVGYGIGAIAAGFRSKLGLRRAHEWILAYAHYFLVAIWPQWKGACTRLRLKFETKTGIRSALLLHESGELRPVKRLRYWRKF